MYEVSKDFTFSASHALLHLPEGHQCHRLHGHNFVVRVVLAAARTDPATGFVLDYGDLAPLGTWLDTTMDHRHLNDVVDFPPTAEAMAQFVYDWCAARGWPVTRVGWSETPRCWAYYWLGQ